MRKKIHRLVFILVLARHAAHIHEIHTHTPNDNKTGTFLRWLGYGCTQAEQTWNERTHAQTHTSHTLSHSSFELLSSLFARIQLSGLWLLPLCVCVLCVDNNCVVCVCVCVFETSVNLVERMCVKCICHCLFLPQNQTLSNQTTQIRRKRHPFTRIAQSSLCVLRRSFPVPSSALRGRCGFRHALLHDFRVFPSSSPPGGALCEAYVQTDPSHFSRTTGVLANSLLAASRI